MDHAETWERPRRRAEHESPARLRRRTPVSEVSKISDRATRQPMASVLEVVTSGPDSTPPSVAVRSSRLHTKVGRSEVDE